MASHPELRRRQQRYHEEESEDIEDERWSLLTSNEWDGARGTERRVIFNREPEIHEALQVNGSRTPIGPDDLHLISPGDHIGWHRPYLIWHHAIVADVDITNRKLSVIHFTKVNEQSQIAEEWINIDKQKGDLFRFDYEDADHPDIVIERARARKGEMGYKFFKKNCEHFATECKTGIPHSAQVRWAWGKTKETLKEGAVNVARGGVKLGCNVVKEMSKQSAIGAIESAGKVGGAEVVEKIAKGSNWVGAAVVAGVEASHCAYDIYHIRKQYKAGKMKQMDFRVTTTQRVSEGVVGAGAAIGGGILGETIGAAVGGAIGSAVPVIGTAIGAAVGAFIGSVVMGALGSFVGKALGSIFGRWFGNWLW